MATTTIADIHPDLIQTHILPLLDGASLSATATASSNLHTLCSDDTLWSRICNSTWPSTTGDPRLHRIISTFPSGHRSFFQDSFPALVTTDANHLPSHPLPPQIISAVDIRYRNDVIYSNLEFTDTGTEDFLSSEFRIRLKSNENPEPKPGIQSIELKLGDIALSEHLKGSMSLNWILIDPIQKRAGNISSIKPVGGWMKENEVNGDTHLLYAVVLPGCDGGNTAVQCRIQAVVGVDAGGVGLRVKEVVLEVVDMGFCRLKGREFLVITQGALSVESKRKMLDDKETRSRYLEFMKMSINSLSQLNSETQKDKGMVTRPWNCLLQKVFHWLCIMVVVVLLIY